MTFILRLSKCCLCKPILTKSIATKPFVVGDVGGWRPTCLPFTVCSLQKVPGLYWESVFLLVRHWKGMRGWNSSLGRQSSLENSENRIKFMNKSTENVNILAKSCKNPWEVGESATNHGKIRGQILQQLSNVRRRQGDKVSSSSCRRCTTPRRASSRRPWRWTCTLENAIGSTVFCCFFMTTGSLDDWRVYLYYIYIYLLYPIFFKTLSYVNVLGSIRDIYYIIFILPDYVHVNVRVRAALAVGCHSVESNGW